MIERRSPHQVGRDIARGINNGNIKFFDKHLSIFAADLVYVCYSSFLHSLTPILVLPIIWFGMRLEELICVNATIGILYHGQTSK